MRATLFGLMAVHLLLGCQPTEKQQVTVANQSISIVFDNKLHTQLIGSSADPPLVEGFQPSEYLETTDGVITDFELESFQSTEHEGPMGSALRHSLTGIHHRDGSLIKKEVTVDSYEDFPDMLIVQVIYTNLGDRDITVRKWANHSYSILDQGDDPPFWSFQGASYEDRRDWIQPLKAGFEQENYMGMNASDYGGGIPVADIWRSDIGVAIGHLAMVPKLVTLPVAVNGQNSASLEILLEKEEILEPQGQLVTLPTFVIVHPGDYYSALQTYSQAMQKKGLEFVPPEEAAYEPIWCAWGYERNFNPAEVLGTLPKVNELGIRWAVLDDGFQIAEGDWDVNPDKFPGGDQDMKDFVSEIHSYGLKAKLWWAPLAVDPGTKLLELDPDIILINDQGNPQDISWWNSYYMSPVYSGTFEHTQSVLQKFLGEWDFDGLKMDGQHMNAVPPDYNPAHNLAFPEESVEKLPEFFRMIYREARAIKPQAVVENCPCGTACSFFNMPYMNQAVSSDPLSSWQIRLKGKTFKALIGRTAYYGDHVELSDNGNDFASSFGIGAVLGTKFTWPADNPSQSRSYLLTPEKELSWKKWFGLYNRKMLSREPYLGSLYDIGYDKPETHVIQKGDTLHYAFYDESWSGEVQLRGLGPNTYRLRNYVDQQDLGSVMGPVAAIELQFEGNLLVEAIPE